MDRRVLLARFRDDMWRLLRATERAHPQSTVIGGWTAREILVHVAAWDRELVRGLVQLLDGQRPSFADYDEAAFNERALREAAVRSLVDAIGDAKAAHAALIDRIAALSDDEWNSTSGLSWRDGQQMTVASLFQYTYNGETHYAGHASEIEARSND